LDVDEADQSDPLLEMTFEAPSDAATYGSPIVKYELQVTNELTAEVFTQDSLNSFTSEVTIGAVDEASEFIVTECPFKISGLVYGTSYTF
jgi:hypothetical protein